MNVVWFSFAASGLVATAWGFLVGIPHATIGAYRTRLWKLRDHLADEILAGKISHTQAGWYLVTRIETRIAIAPSLNPFRLIVLALTIDRETRSEMASVNKPKYNPERYAEFSPYIQELDHADRRHLFTGSPSGWLLIVLVFVAALVTLPYVILFERVLGRRPDHDSALVRSRQLTEERLENSYEDTIERVVGIRSVAGVLVPSRHGLAV